jgi:hypothetical protein
MIYDVSLITQRSRIRHIPYLNHICNRVLSHIGAQTK